MFTTAPALILAFTTLVSLTTAEAAMAQSSIFTSGSPAEVDSGDPGSVELGVKFKSDSAGSITGIRFYKAAANTGTHVGHLWTSGGQLLASATFASETASGWQQVDFATPVAITAGTTYVASYFDPHGHYSWTTNGLSSGVDNAPLHAIGDRTSADGVYAYSATSTFPTSTYQASNYWVDVAFAPTGTAGVSPTASFTYSPKSPVTGQTVHFDASASECYATPCTYTWADDPPSGGSWPFGSGQALDFTFQQAATKYITLTVTDAANQTATIEHDVVVAAGTTAAPSNTGLPVISGTATQGQTLSTSSGTWNGSPTSYSYQWQDCNSAGAGCSNIGGATSSSYTLAASDVTHTVRVLVTASNSGGAGSAAASSPTAVVTASSGGGGTGGGNPSSQANCAGAASSNTPNYAALDACGYPSPDTAGIPAGTTLTPIAQAKLPAGASWSGGELDISGNNVTVTGVSITNGNVHITGVNDTLSDSLITGDGNPEVLIYHGASNTVMDHDEVEAPTSTIGAINNAGGQSFTITNSYLHDNCTGVLGVGVTAKNNYMITDGNVPGCHVEDAYIPGGKNQPATDYEHNTLLNPLGQTAAIFLDNHCCGSGNSNITENNNLMAGGGYITYGDSNGDGSSNIVITNNRFSRLYYPDGGYYGAEVQNDAATTFSGNIWDDTLAAVKPNS